jgi:hypothetical protein
LPAAVLIQRSIGTAAIHAGRTSLNSAGRAPCLGEAGEFTLQQPDGMNQIDYFHAVGILDAQGICQSPQIFR